MEPQSDTMSTSDLSELSSAYYDEPTRNTTPSSLAPKSPTPKPLLARYLRKKKTRVQRAHKLWSHARPAQEGEDTKDRFSHKMWYCALDKSCEYEGTSTLKNARKHLLDTHRIHCVEDDSLRKKAIQQSVDTLFSKQERKSQVEPEEKTIRLLTATARGRE
ncbi:hypothetical protein B0A49_04904 [Cryomyces minteri]|uniref:BED-type domain-containing protein n=1 Tax=Cryomyces minteri TaxID=331657 RepID=A0A4U0XXH0_9PEZI|nr:hypothetical protein B0A49_04904 [Cryomyces minteri]